MCLGNVTKHHGLKHNFIVNNTQMYVFFKSRDNVVQHATLDYFDQYVVVIENIGFLHASKITNT